MALPDSLRRRSELHSALRSRRSRRTYAREELALDQVSQVLWSALGITSPGGRRTVASAGALHPLELHLVAAHVEDLPPGLYHYDLVNHALIRRGFGDCRPELAVAAYQQHCVRIAAAVVAITAVFERTTGKYGERGVRYVHMEAGLAAQNVYLQAASLHIGTVLVGAFDDREVKRVLDLPREEQPLGLMPLGRL
ncbi:MAG: SagB/ThcOx family dehydrogenase [Myxococcota bacterium]